MSFSSYMQDLFHAKAKELGLDLDEINHNGTRRKHLDTLSFKVEQETAHLQHLQAETAIEEQRLQNVRQDIEDAKNAAPQSFKLKTQQNHHMNELEKDQAVLRCVEELAPDIVRQARAGVQSHRKSVDMPTRSR
jgi:predicted  nucleic acid-binding Zn-ribbon protein